jgi:[ribosomal protein S18]-alanine N-acetyltransferase
LTPRSKMSLRIEAITPTHAAVLAALHASGFEEPWPDEAFVRLLSDSSRYGALAIDCDSPVGFVMLQLTPDEAEILTLVVEPRRRRTGVGRRLMNWAIEDAARAGLKRLILDVSDFNPPARRLYDGLGFVQIGERSGYYARPQGAQTALILSLNLSALTSVVPREPTR